MIIRTLADLQAPDEQTQHFTPLGLGVTCMLTPEAAVGYQHSLLAATDLVDDVAKGTQRNFDRLRTLFVYGVLEYEFFTIAGQFARLVIEQALRDRFLAFYENGIVLVNQRTSRERLVRVDSFDQVREAFKQPGGPWRLKLATSRAPLKFNGMLDSLWTWARFEGLLPGQRARSLQRVQVDLRNTVAHPSSYHLGTPGDAALVIRDVAEIINCLWGHRTPSGRLHSAPVQRSVLLIAWDDNGRIKIGDVLDDPGKHTVPDCTSVLVRATADHLEDLTEFDARFETTLYPIELLWGPGSPEKARAWFDTNHPGGDESDQLDRHFLIRRHSNRLDAPRRASVAAGLPTATGPERGSSSNPTNLSVPTTTSEPSQRRTAPAQGLARAPPARPTPSHEATGLRSCNVPQTKILTSPPSPRPTFACHHHSPAGDKHSG